MLLRDPVDGMPLPRLDMLLWMPLPLPQVAGIAGMRLQPLGGPLMRMQLLLEELPLVQLPLG